MPTDPLTWVLIAVLAVIASLVVFILRRVCKHGVEPPRRTLAEALVRTLFRLARFFRAAAIGADKGLVHFHLERQRIRIDPENELARAR